MGILGRRDSKCKTDIYEAFLNRLDGLHGHMALCPAHADRHPSLSVHPGEQGILIHCFAGCSPDDICRALEFTPRDLFYDRDHPKGIRRASRKAPPIPWRRSAGQIEDFALGLWLRGTDVFSAARGLNTAEWTDEDFDVAMEALTAAHVDLVRADMYSDLAFHLRSGGLRKEAADALRRQHA